MKKYYHYLSVLLLLTSLVVSCKLATEDDSIVDPNADGGPVTLTGKVINHVTSLPISNAIVKINNLTSTVGTITDDQGSYSFDIEIDEAKEIKLIASKDGYRPDTVTVSVAPNTTVQAPDLRLRQSGNGEDDLPVISDEAASIYLKSQSTDKLGIRESGDIETAYAVFEVIDSSGVPITDKRYVNVEFSILAGPGGGEFLYPAKTQTNENGLATVAITSGTKAGVVQIQAKVDHATKVIRSKPIFFTIYGGFPVPERFAVACKKFNYPFWGLMNEEIDFTALIGDKYSNPVRPNTAVYFNTTEGVIGKFEYTDDLGRATSTLATFGFPNHATFGPGFFEVFASTVTENSEIITTSTMRLLTSPPVAIIISPDTSFYISNGGSIGFTVETYDVNGHPLSSDYTITINTSGTIKANPASIKIPDSMVPGINSTIFAFVIGDADAENFTPGGAAAISITIKGPYGEYTSAPVSGFAE